MTVGEEIKNSRFVEIIAIKSKTFGNRENWIRYESVNY